jgi:hypothetical protein
MDDFLISMNIHITPLDDFHRQSLSSFLDEISQLRSSNIVDTGKKCRTTLFYS